MPPPPPIRVYGEPIERTPQFKYLGTLISQDGYFHEDIKAKVAKATTTFTRLRPFLRSADIPMNVRLRLYKACVISQMLYGSEPWSTSTALFAPLRRLHHSALRTITHRHPQCHNKKLVWPRSEDLYALAGVPAIERIWAQQRQNWWNRVQLKDMSFPEAATLHLNHSGESHIRRTFANVMHGNTRDPLSLALRELGKGKRRDTKRVRAERLPAQNAADASARLDTQEQDEAAQAQIPTLDAASTCTDTSEDDTDDDFQDVQHVYAAARPEAALATVAARKRARQTNQRRPPADNDAAQPAARPRAATARPRPQTRRPKRGRDEEPRSTNSIDNRAM